MDLNKKFNSFVKNMQKLYKNKNVQKIYKFINNNKFVKFFNKRKSSEIRDPKFRNKVIKRYSKCIVSDTYSKSEVDACHIVPVKDNNNIIKSKDINDVSNGILLNKMLHSTFDKYYWSINPKTFCIEINHKIKKEELGHILKYNEKKLPLEGIDDYFLTIHYKEFKKKMC